MDDWPTLPQLARELDIADSTSRRWAASFSDFLSTKGHGPTRRFHPQTREVLKRVQTLYASGFNTEQVAEVLRHEFPAIINTVAIPASDERAHEHKDVTTLQSALVALVALTEQQTALQTHVAQMQERFVQELRETETRLEGELTATRTENTRLWDYIDKRLEERDRQLTQATRLMIEKKQATQRKSWWQRICGRKS